MFAIISESHLFLLLLILVIIFGIHKLPTMARSIGDALKELRKAREEKDKDES